MTHILETESRLTDRYQTTIPASVRKALSLQKRDRLRFVVQADGQVLLTRMVDGDADDPVIGQFLEFLAADMQRHPERIQALDASLAERISGLTGDLEVDLDAPQADDDE
ncbi:MAG: type II toxin-antitoxin system PrlF family antitoxin [Gammaproteobacteria bacterium]|nr:type II toxin-antitoxin system PrlF family antitoxin [Gammaproteobacteria bacterium]